MPKTDPKNESYSSTRLVENTDQLSGNLLVEYHKQQDALEVGESIIETEQRLQAERQELREELRGHSGMYRDAYRESVAEAERHRLGLLLDGNQQRLSAIAPRARQANAELNRLATEESMTDDGYRNLVQSAVLAAAKQVEPLARVALANSSARKQLNLQLPPIPRMVRVQLDELVTWCKELERRDLLDTELLPVSVRGLLEGGL